MPNTIIINLKAVFLPEKILQSDVNDVFLEKSLKKSKEICPVFDPFAVKEINEIAKKTKAHFVFTDGWFWTNEFDITSHWMKENGVDIKLHKNCFTPKKMSSIRINEIQWWIENNPKDNILLILDEHYSTKNIAISASEEEDQYLRYKEKYKNYLGQKRRLSLIPQHEYFKFEDYHPFYGIEAKKILFVDEKIGLTKELIRLSWEKINQV